ncbi:hypothetical protein CP979_00210 [Streptomyces filamentosus]|nr:hypothetical protein CP979_00210 [Streptomyces filamentosus]
MSIFTTRAVGPAVLAELRTARCRRGEEPDEAEDGGICAEEVPRKWGRVAWRRWPGGRRLGGGAVDRGRPGTEPRRYDQGGRHGGRKVPGEAGGSREKPEGAGGGLFALEERAIGRVPGPGFA